MRDLAQQLAYVFQEVGRQLQDLYATWKSDAQARALVFYAVGAGLSVVLLAVAVEVLRYLDLHHYRARFLSLTTDRSLPELVMDALALIAAALTARLFLRTGLRSFLLFSVLLCLIAIDDFFSLHESLGTVLVNWLGIPDSGNLKGQAVGELVFLIAFALVCIPLFLWSAWGLQAENLAILVIYGVVFALFAGFSGGVDFLHSLAQSSFMDRLMGWIEEGGEIVMISVLTSVAILQSRGRSGF